MNRFLPLIVLASFLAVACESANEGPTTVSGPANRQPPPAVEDYLGGVLSRFAGILELDRVDPEQYSSLVRQFREDGLDALTDDDRRDLLLVAQGAFLSYAETLRYSAVGIGSSSEGGPDSKGQATLEQVFVRRDLPDEESPFHERAVLSLAAAHLTTQSIAWIDWLTAYWDPRAHGEALAFIDFPNHGELESEDVAVSEWSNEQGRWICYRGGPELGEVYFGREFGRVLTLGSLASGTLLGRDELDGRVAYRFETVREDKVYWLDGETLWLRQYEYVDTDGARITVKLEAINEDIHIEPPDVDVECVEEEAE